MPRHRDFTIGVVVEQLGDPEPGEWCPVCLLPSAYTIPFAVTIGSHIAVVTPKCCPECGWQVTAPVPGC